MFTFVIAIGGLENRPNNRPVVDRVWVRCVQKPIAGRQPLARNQIKTIGSVS